LAEITQPLLLLCLPVPSPSRVQLPFLSGVAAAVHQRPRCFRGLSFPVPPSIFIMVRLSQDGFLSELTRLFRTSNSAHAGSVQLTFKPCQHDRTF
jgi:hypothetical protein